MIDCEIESCPFSLVNVYAPTRDRLNEQLAFIDDLRNILLNLGEKKVIIGGDFNTHINLDLDRKGGVRNTYSKYTQFCENLIDDMDLVDRWRIRHPNEQTFT